MTSNEATAFVNDEIRSRYRTLNDTQFGDWVSVAKRVDLSLARAIVHDLVQDPDKTLNLKDFKRLAWQRRPRVDREAADLPGYDPYIRCIAGPAEHPDWEDKDWFRSERFKRANCGDQKYVANYAAEEAAAVQAVKGGRWCGLVKPMDSIPYRGTLTQIQVREQAERHILNGPQGPGRRWLLNRRSAAEKRSHIGALLCALPAVTRPPKPAPPTHQQLEALRTGKPDPLPAREKRDGKYRGGDIDDLERPDEPVEVNKMVREPGEDDETAAGT